MSDSKSPPPAKATVVNPTPPVAQTGIAKEPTNEAMTVSAKSCTVTFSDAKELAEKLNSECKQSLIVLGPTPSNESSTEKFFQDNGMAFILGLALFYIFSLVLLGFSHQKKNQSPNRDNSDRNESEQSRFILHIKTPTGMSIALLVGTALTCALGVTLVAIYKYLDFPNDFAQGSGSLIQAIWGSAATITAAIVAIMLALESIKQSETTNKLQQQANNLASRQSSLYEAWQVGLTARKYLIQFDRVFVNIIARQGGMVNQFNYKLYMHYNDRIINKLEEILQSSIIDMFSQISVPSSYSKDISDSFEIKNFADVIYQLILNNYSQVNLTANPAASAEEFSLNARTNNIGQSNVDWSSVTKLSQKTWAPMMLIIFALDLISFEDIILFEENSTSWHKNIKREKIEKFNNQMSEFVGAPYKLSLEEKPIQINNLLDVSKAVIENSKKQTRIDKVKEIVIKILSIDSVQKYNEKRDEVEKMANLIERHASAMNELVAANGDVNNLKQVYKRLFVDPTKD